jgi:L-lactate dehydrogenase complex protein LldG
VNNPTRDLILTNIRNALERQVLTSEQENALKQRLINHPVHEQPVLKQPLLTQFITQLEKVAGTHEIIRHEKEIPFAVLAFLQQHHLPLHVVVDAHLKTISWPTKLQTAYRAARAEDLTSISYAFAAVAETGSIVLLSDALSPTTLNFLPDNHIVLVEVIRLVGYLEEVWQRLRTQSLPRTINIITGPSRTADIEQTIQLGAHGPRRLHIILNKSELTTF